MAKRKPIETAPKDGRRVQVFWTDADGQENESVARYISSERLKGTGGDRDESDTGWWTYIDSDTQKRIAPHSWTSGEDDE